MVFFRRGREKEARRTKTGQDRDRPDRAGERRGDRMQWCLSLFRAEYFSIVFILGARILSFRHNYCQCVEMFYGLFGLSLIYCGILARVVTGVFS